MPAATRSRREPFPVRDDGGMAAVERLVTSVDLEHESADGRSSTVSARLEAVLVDGRRVLLLDDRGWSSSGSSDIWASTTLQEMENTARMVVGPDEPPPGRSWEAEEALHWAHLAGTLDQHGVPADGVELMRLPHDVVLSEPLLTRLARSRPDTCHGSR